MCPCVRVRTSLPAAACVCIENIYQYGKCNIGQRTRVWAWGWTRAGIRNAINVGFIVGFIAEVIGGFPVVFILEFIVKFIVGYDAFNGHEPT